MSMINKLFDDHHFSTVLLNQYYAAITKLHIPGIKDNLTAVAKKCGGVQNHRLRPKILTSNSCVDLKCDKKKLMQRQSNGVNLTVLKFTPLAR